MMADVKMRNAFSAMDQICGDLPYTAEDQYYEMLDNIAIAVVDYRVSHGLSQAQLADQLGVSQAMISKYESGDYNISLKALVELFDKLSIPLDVRFGADLSNSSEDRETKMHYSKYRKMQVNNAVSSPEENQGIPQSAA